MHPAPLSLGNYSCLFLATKSTGEWKPIKDLSNLNAFMYCRAAFNGNTSVNPRAIQKGQWLTSLDLKDPYFHIVCT